MSDHKGPYGEMIADVEICDLIDACVSNQATPDQWLRLSRLIVDREDVRACYAAQSMANARLAALLQIGEQDELGVFTQIEQEPAPRVMSSIPKRKPAIEISSEALLTLLCGAAAVVLVCGVVMSQWLITTRVDSGPIAVTEQVPPAVLRQVEANAGAEIAVHPRELFASTLIELPSGKYEATTSVGATIKLAGPARLRIEDHLTWKLFTGKMVVHAPPAAKGFTVKTDNAEIVDLGTEFGVIVDSAGVTSVAVFDGKVDLASGESQKSLVIGDGFTISKTGRLDHLSIIDPSRFEEPGEDLTPPLISEVRNNSLISFGACQIIRGGFREDALAYVDRKHQWNGVDASGLPEELVGVDYVRMVNDWKFDEQIEERDDLEFAVTFARPATVYLLVDERITPPIWLRRNFAKTGMQVGLDEGTHNCVRTGLSYEKEQAKGPGNSIDVVMRVWKTDLPEGGELKIGPIGSKSRGWVVPCIVARPL
ncbi:FecR family protein [Blastopirellula sp. JC732]|uniref:FecR family protein n=1 Tax=Blastopirellula sediminis TaxID=2894196 RepID=A0A9X1MTB2_9BACT|nr:FecR domain-containing protein [Blastopirellula sediminis]MCC9604686.1 FecR family protein [Blastopirellula sediminis]MCC9632015.1 FecR family protein [Blastopirellula sediminis]